MVGPQKPRKQSDRHRTVPIPESLTTIPGYPKKLVIYLCDASSFWQVRYFAEGRIFRRSAKTENKIEAMRVARRFFDEVTWKIRQHGADASAVTFQEAYESLVAAELAQLNRGQLTAQSVANRKYRFEKIILPHFGKRDVTRIDYAELEIFLNSLSSQDPPLGVSTIAAYMGLVRKVLQQAARKNWIHHIPEFPHVGVEDKPRGWFTVAEYQKLYRTAKSLIGKTADEIRIIENDGTSRMVWWLRDEPRPVGSEKVRSQKITAELNDMIVFTINSFIRPTDLKNMQNKHVDVINGESTYLKLNLPPSKGHKHPIATMRWAVKVYERIARRNAAKGMSGPEDYVFMPERNNKNSRDYALVALTRQFDALLDITGLKRSVTGEVRTLYSLRHSCIMYRLIYGRSINTLALARNSRTSPEMIDRFYAAPLQGEMAIAEIQSKKRPRIWER